MPISTESRIRLIDERLPIQQMYETMYAQQVEDDIAARDQESPYRLNRDPKLYIRPFSELVGATASSPSEPVTLEVLNRVTHIKMEQQFDVVICGTG